MEMVINAYALNLSAEEAIAPRQGVISRMVSWVTRMAVPQHILAATSIELD